MTAEIERYTPTTTTPTVRPPDIDSWIAVIGDVAKLATHICDTDFVPNALRGNAAAVAAAILSGREAGVGPMASLQNINVIKGKPGPNAILMRQLALAAGHEIRYVETTDSRCVVEGRRRGTERWERVTFTADQARRARIDLGGYPEDKLVARATSRLCRRLFPDAIGGMPYSVEELEDGIDDHDTMSVTVASDGEQPTAEPKPRTAQRKTRQKPAPVVRTQPPPAPADDQEDLPPLPGEDGYDDTDQAEAKTTTPAVDEPTPITDAQMRKLQTLFSKHDITNRGDRLILASQLVGRDLESAKDLNIAEASAAIDTLERAEEIAGENFGDFLQRLTAATAAANAGENFGDFLQRLTAATAAANTDEDIDPDTGEIVDIDQPTLNGDQ